MLLLALLLAAPTATASASNSQGNYVLPATARPFGISLTQMLQKTAVFESDFIGGVPAAPDQPSTPFQILSNLSTSYTINSHTMMYVPVFTFDDSPQIAGCPPETPACTGVWPADDKAALSYVYSAQKVGAHDMAITIDGAKTTLSQSYLAGPVSAGLHDGGSNMLVIAAYVVPLPVGSHTVTISGVLDGAYIPLSFGITSIGPFSLGYTVNVTP
jgi:hypothetical protein